jgi:hypothetical protein
MNDLPLMITKLGTEVITYFNKLILFGSSRDRLFCCSQILYGFADADPTYEFGSGNFIPKKTNNC